MISINFASRDYRFIAGTRAGFITGCVLLVIVMAGMVWMTMSLRADAAALDGKLKKAAAEEERIRPLIGEREQLVRDLTAMSGLTDARKISWTRFLTSIEAVVPKGVAMTRVAYNAKEKTVALDGKAKTPEALRSLMLGLEKSKSFLRPFLKHQSLDKGTISFNVIAVYHEEKAPVVAGGAQR